MYTQDKIKKLREACRTNLTDYSVIRNLINNIKDESILMDLIKINGEILIHIKNATNQMKLAAIKRNPSVIRYIDNPTEEMQLLAVKTAHSTFPYLKSSFLSVQILAMQQKKEHLSYIMNPSEELQIASIERYGGSIVDYLRNLSTKAQIMVIKDDPANIYSIDSELDISNVMSSILNSKTNIYRGHKVVAILNKSVKDYIIYFYEENGQWTQKYSNWDEYPSKEIEDEINMILGLNKQ